MPASNDAIKVTGLRDFQAALREMDSDLPKMLRVALNEVSETVVQGSRRRVPMDSGRARKSIRAASGQREAKVRAGSKKVAYYGWLDFGGRVGRKRSIHRKFIQGGRYLYPAYAANRESILKAMAASLNKLAESAGLEVT